jgi:16S rRNA C967 or C1407 C5-methylase (RsmB/RsmF family)
LLLFSVCSWLPEEGEQLKESILKENLTVNLFPAWVSAPGGKSTCAFSLDPLAWDGEGFQAFAFIKKELAP